MRDLALARNTAADLSGLEGTTVIGGHQTEAPELCIREVPNLAGDDRCLSLPKQDFQAGVEPHDLIGRDQFALAEVV
jgi:hypothetical protein